MFVRRNHHKPATTQMIRNTISNMATMSNSLPRGTQHPTRNWTTSDGLRHGWLGASRATHAHAHGRVAPWRPRRRGSPGFTRGSKAGLVGVAELDEAGPMEVEVIRKAPAATAQSDLVSACRHVPGDHWRDARASSDRSRCRFPGSIGVVRMGGTFALLADLDVEAKIRHGPCVDVHPSACGH